jgi:hypothetical protein
MMKHSRIIPSVLGLITVLGLAFYLREPTPQPEIVVAKEVKKVQTIKKKVKKFRPDGSLASEEESDESLDLFIAAKLRKPIPQKPDNLIVSIGAKINLFRLEPPKLKSVDVLYRPIDKLPAYIGAGYDKEYNEAQIKAAYSSRVELF